MQSLKDLRNLVSPPVDEVVDVPAQQIADADVLPPPLPPPQPDRYPPGVAPPPIPQGYAPAPRLPGQHPQTAALVRQQIPPQVLAQLQRQQAIEILKAQGINVEQPNAGRRVDWLWLGGMVSLVSLVFVVGSITSVQLSRSPSAQVMQLTNENTALAKMAIEASKGKADICISFNCGGREKDQPPQPTQPVYPAAYPAGYGYNPYSPYNYAPPPAYYPPQQRSRTFTPQPPTPQAPPGYQDYQPAPPPQPEMPLPPEQQVYSAEIP